MYIVRSFVLCMCLFFLVQPANQAYAFFGLFSDSNISMVQEGFFEYDKSVTVQDALEGNQYFKNPSWESVEDSQKRIYVVFRAEVDVDLLLRQTQHAPAPLPDFLATIHLEFIINKNDTFKLGYVAYTAPYGEIYAPQYVSDVEKEYEAIYSNTISNTARLKLFGVLRSGLADAIQEKDVEKAKYLIEAGANPNVIDVYGRESLQKVAISADNVEILKLLLEKGAKPNLQDKHGITPLQVAVWSAKSSEMVKLLLEYGADPNIKGVQGDSILMSTENNPNEEIVALLLKHGADPNATNESGDTALMELVTDEKHISKVKLLLASGVKINHQNDSGNTALTRAISHSTTKNMIKLLLENGANPNLHGSKQSPALIRAISNSTYYQHSKEVARLLLEYGANPDARNQYGNTALLEAMNLRDTDILELLLQYGANPTLKAQFGDTIKDHYNYKKLPNNIKQMIENYNPTNSTKQPTKMPISNNQAPIQTTAQAPTQSITQALTQHSNQTQASSHPCPDGIIGTNTVQGEYYGWGESDGLYAVMVGVASSEFPINVLATYEEAVQFFGEEAGGTVEVTYDVEQSYYEEDNLCNQFNLIKSGRRLN